MVVQLSISQAAEIIPWPVPADNKPADAIAPKVAAPVDINTAENVEEVLGSNSNPDTQANSPEALGGGIICW